MNAKISVFAICVEAIVFLLYNLHDSTFNENTPERHTNISCTFSLSRGRVCSGMYFLNTKLLLLYPE